MSVKGNRNYTGAAGKMADHRQSNFFKTNTEGDMTRGTSNLSQFFMTRTENAPLLHRRRLGPCSTL